MPAVMQKFREDNTFRTSARKLIMPREYKAKLFVAKTWHNLSETEKSKRKGKSEERKPLLLRQTLERK